MSQGLGHKSDVQLPLCGKEGGWRRMRGGQFSRSCDLQGPGQVPEGAQWLWTHLWGVSIVAGISTHRRKAVAGSHLHPREKWYLKVTQGSHPPQGLCTGCSLCLQCSSPDFCMAPSCPPLGLYSNATFSQKPSPATPPKWSPPPHQGEPSVFSYSTPHPPEAHVTSNSTVAQKFGGVTDTIRKTFSSQF